MKFLCVLLIVICQYVVLLLLLIRGFKNIYNILNNSVGRQCGI